MSEHPAPAYPALIADDEAPSRALLRHLLANHADFSIVAECGDGDTALAAIKRHAPRVAFLDIKMPRLDGLSLLERLEPASRPLVVFTTAHDTFAIQAFAAHAFDYLLKPFDRERFERSLERVRHHLRQADEARLGQSIRNLITSPFPTAAPATSTRPDRIVIRETGRVFFVDIPDLEWLEAAGNYVTLHLAGGKSHLAHETMQAMETRLGTHQFVRIHRSTMVRIDRIKELLPHFNGEYIVILKDGARLKLSRTYLEPARAQLGLT